MSAPQPIPVTAADVDTDFDATASPAPGTVSSTRRLGVLAQAEPVIDPAAADPGHLATPEEWAAIVARAEGGRS